MVFPSSIIKFPIVYAYSSIGNKPRWNQLIILIGNYGHTSFFGNTMNWAYPRAVRDMDLAFFDSALLVCNHPPLRSCEYKTSADPRVPLILGRSFLRTGRALIDVYGEEITLRINEESITFHLNQTMRYSSNYDDTSVKRVDVIDIACEKIVQDVLDFQYNSKSSSPTLVSDDSIFESDSSKEPIVKSSSPTLTPFGKIQSQRRLNPKIHDVIKKEVIKLLDAGTFQRCMMSIFHDMIEKTMEVFMDDFLVFGDSFSSCLTNFDKMLNRCEETNLVLNWEKCRFICRVGIVLGHKISKSNIEVDKAKVDVIAKLPHPTTVKGVRSFLGHNLTEAPILVVPNWNLPFELMCDASFYAIGAVLGQRKTKHFSPIHYAIKMMSEAQIHYTMTEKEMLVVIYAFEKFWPYLVLSKSIVYTDHSALKYFLNKQDAKPRLLRWVLLLQEFDITILEKKGSENLTADHLSKLENPRQDVLENKDINENFSLENIGTLTSHSTTWFADIINFHAGNFI
nr:retrovirus-related Pol polyprotein from transposon 17.6 [Tanacetum cinerariifolium]